MAGQVDVAPTEEAPAPEYRSLGRDLTLSEDDATHMADRREGDLRRSARRAPRTGLPSTANPLAVRHSADPSGSAGAKRWEAREELRLAIVVSIENKYDRRRERAPHRVEFETQSMRPQTPPENHPPHWGRHVGNC